MDEHHFEHAAKLEQMMRDKAMERAKEKEARLHAKPENFDGTCPLCEVEIPQARIELGYYICIECREKQEQRTRFTPP